jgi:hypothetical protein
VGALTISIHPARDRTLDFLAVRRALSREGVRPGRMIVVADGTVEDGRFRIDGWPETFPLTESLPAGRVRLRASVRMDGGEVKFRPAGDPPAG